MSDERRQDDRRRGDRRDELPKDKGREYLDHLTGISSLVLWLDELERAGFSYRIDGHLVILSDAISKRFCIGVPSHRSFGRYPFLAVQPREARFMRLIRFTKAVVYPDSRGLYLVASALSGDGASYQDIPPVALMLPFDGAQKPEILSMSPRLEAKSLWFDDVGTPRVGNKDVFWSVPLVTLPQGASLLEPEDSAASARPIMDLVKKALGKP